MSQRGNDLYVMCVCLCMSWGNLSDSMCLCSLLASVCAYLIHHLRAVTFFFCLNLDKKLFHFFNLFLAFFLFPCGLEMSLQDVALVSRRLKPLRVTLVITFQILWEKCLAGCNVSVCLFFGSILSAPFSPSSAVPVYLYFSWSTVYLQSMAYSLFTLLFLLLPLFFI